LNGELPNFLYVFPALNGGIDKTALDWSPKAVRIRRRFRKTWNRVVAQEANIGGKIWSEIKKTAHNRKRMGATGIADNDDDLHL
jgi:hypothetical protein